MHKHSSIGDIDHSTQKEQKMKLAEIMEEKNMTTKRLAELTGISQRTLEAYRSGRREPKYSTGLDIAKALSVDPYALKEENMEKLYERKWIKVEKVDHVDTTWGVRYYLYVDNDGNYYADLDDDGREIMNISKYKQIEEREAKEIFAEYIKELEAAQNEE